MSVFLILCLFNLQGFASIGVFADSYTNGEGNEFTCFDEAGFYDEFQEISALESFLSDNDASYHEIADINSQLLLNVSESSALPFSPEMAEGPVLGIPSFLWGCVLSWVGLIIVYVMADDTAETKKALWGCILGTLVWGGSSVLFY